MTVHIYKPEQQAIGAFDEGRITEQKPIGFPGEDSVLQGIGPLFYWAWAEAHEDSVIGLHPHRGFEIMTYVIDGKVGHYDTLGTRSSVGRGGVQLMQTASGVSHEEHFAKSTQGMQIWFEPFLKDALKRNPTYTQFEHDQFPIEMKDGVIIKTVIGEGSSIEIVADAKMWDIEASAGVAYKATVPTGYSLAVLLLDGQGKWSSSADKAMTPVQSRDFAVFHAENDTKIQLEATEDAPIRALIIQIPTDVEYPLLRNK
ncbi:pirin family protein [Paenibacillus sp. N1-5-1-14]|uniref:pirin family protein n=1 Tax=Paenibacillus radicibacter TaxID=2972488 RepID=UPI002159415B|nr:pirin family protein [Paenibacillus radicibacter]MCR8644090.1 pirin family protein [Paenibacillus radicibacter]